MLPFRFASLCFLDFRGGWLEYICGSSAADVGGGSAFAVEVAVDRMESLAQYKRASLTYVYVQRLDFAGLMTYS